MKELENILDIINNQDRYSKYLKEIKAVTDKSESALKSIDNYKQIDSLHAAATTALSKAQTVLDNALVEATLIESNAAASLKQRQDNLTRQENRVNLEHKNLVWFKNTTIADLDEREKAVEKAEKSVSSREKAADKLRLESSKVIADFNTKKEVLDKVVKEVA